MKHKSQFICRRLLNLDLSDISSRFDCILVSTSLSPATIRSSRPILYFPCSLPRTSHVSKEPDSFNWRMVFRKQDMGTSCAHCQWAISDSRQTLSMDSDKKYCWPLNNVGVTPCITTVSQSSIASDPLRPHVQPAPDHVLLQ